MIGLFRLCISLLAAFKSKLRLEAENAALRHQLIILRRRVQGRVWLTNNDRWLPLIIQEGTAWKIQPYWENPPYVAPG